MQSVLPAYALRLAIKRPSAETPGRREVLPAVSTTTGTQPAAMLFSHGRTAPTSLPVLGLILAVLGGAAISQILQTWYAKKSSTQRSTAVRPWRAPG
jgi:hypothetical protein